MKAPSPVARKRFKRALLGAAGAIAIGAALAVGGNWLNTGRYLESTNDAYVKADYTTIAPKVSGYVAEVLVEDNDPVKAGQVLARIDARDFQTALDRAKADVAAAKAGIDNIDAQLALQNSVIDQAKADIVAAEAGRSFADQDYRRYRDLVKTGYGTVQRAQQAQANLRQQAAQLERGRAGLIAAQSEIAVLKTQRAQAETTLAHAEAAEEQASLNLGYTEVTAPIGGTVGARQLRVGQYVNAGTALMAVVPLHAVYVVANFKETQLTAMRGGEPVSISVDSFPGRKLHGHVDSLAPASGLEFSLLPPDNATGNFTKIVQRIPVKIRIDANDPLNGLLRAGMSVEAVIDTKPTVLALKKSENAVASR
jgi:membrane fusion protein (multidrug efflux system)